MLRFNNSLIHDKLVQRMVYILESLDNGQKLVSSKQLAEQLNCSIRTISNDITQLKAHFPENWDIYSIKTKGYLLIKPTNQSTGPIINMLMKESVIYRIMLDIFNNKFFKLEKWSQILYCNKLTVKNNLKNHRRMLIKGDLDIDFREVQLIGEEINIRHYYCAFFYNTKNYTDSILLASELRDKILSILEKNKILIDFEMVYCIIFVFIKRFFQKRYITKRLEFYPILDRGQVKAFKEVISTIEDYYKIILPDYEKEAMYNYLFLATNNTEIQNELTNAYLWTFKSKEYDNYLKLISILIDNNKVIDDQKEILKLSLITIFYKRLIQSEYSLSMGFLFDPPEKVQSALLKNYLKNERLVLFWNKTYNKQRFLEEEIKYFATYATIFINSLNDKVDILFLFNGSVIERTIARSLLKESLGENVIIHEVPDDSIKYNLVITNYSTRFKDIPTMYFSGKITEYNIELFRKQIFKIS
ncbi:helix-turn-helix domain containing protein [Bacillus cereus]|uniref:helix-turn-helix domain-containing protein n=1 Tax=Bacillus cereus TaxID=1396 RepID=UPI000BFC8BE5|nr:helix-turn-helix domain containing protein [Bacillus cereus]PGV99675.1 hypothetical protein COD80_02680 [Bacillus cereus]PGY27004.1 hypothetical protein COE27_23310 [Bacillus cereus]